MHQERLPRRHTQISGETCGVHEARSRRLSPLGIAGGGDAENLLCAPNSCSIFRGSLCRQRRIPSQQADWVVFSFILIFLGIIIGIIIGIICIIIGIIIGIICIIIGIIFGIIFGIIGADLVFGITLGITLGVVRGVARNVTRSVAYLGTVQQSSCVYGCV